MVSEDADLVFVDAGGEGVLVSDMRKSRFERESWLRWVGKTYDALQRFPVEGDVSDQQGGYLLACDEHACRLDVKKADSVYHLSYVKQYNPDAYRMECEWADVVVSQDVYDDVTCAAKTINRRDGKYNGAHGIVFSSGLEVSEDVAKLVLIERVSDFRYERPWNGK